MRLYAYDSQAMGDVRPVVVDVHIGLETIQVDEFQLDLPDDADMMKTFHVVRRIYIGTAQLCQPIALLRAVLRQGIMPKKVRYATHAIELSALQAAVNSKTERGHYKADGQTNTDDKVQQSIWDDFEG